MENSAPCIPDIDRREDPLRKLVTLNNNMTGNDN